MTSLLVVPQTENGFERCSLGRTAMHIGLAAACAMALASCAAHPTHYAAASGGRYYDARLGVWASPRVVADGEPIPRGGGGYLVGRPYSIGGRAYYPSERPDGYTVVGTASWYGDAFHGRRTANGEIFDKNSISAAHPTLPLPSYVRVTNMKNGRSMIVRVNDRGPYHGGRVMDVSQRVAEALAFKGEGTARIRVDYIGKASLAGSDDNKLMATLRLDGSPAELDGSSSAPRMVADAGQDPEPARPPAGDERIARASEAETEPPAPGEPPPRFRRVKAPVPPSRPFDFDPALDPAPAPSSRDAVDRLMREHAARRESVQIREFAVNHQPAQPSRPLVTFGGSVAQDNAGQGYPEPVRRPRLTAQDGTSDEQTDH